MKILSTERQRQCRLHLHLHLQQAMVVTMMPNFAMQLQLLLQRRLPRRKAVVWRHHQTILTGSLLRSTRPSQPPRPLQQQRFQTILAGFVQQQTQTRCRWLH